MFLKGLFSRQKSSRRKPPPTPEVPPILVPPTCPNCMSRPVAAKPTSGQFFDYCSKACATQARSGNSSTLCQQCKQRPKFKDGTATHPYCGRTCAKLAANGRANPPSPPVNPPPPNIMDSFFVPPSTSSTGPFCQNSDCTLPAFLDPNGTQSNYCTLHKKLAEHGCVSCRIAPSIDKSVLCETCYDDALSMAPALIQVPEDHNNYKSVEKQFIQTWRHKTTCPEVKAVYKIVISEASMTQYQRYLDDVESRGNFVAMGKSRGNENRRWHGTKRKCRLGDPGNKTFCADVGCALCCIIRTSFDLKFFKAATGWGRFGHGIYTSSTSSKSNDYSKNLGVSSEWKALLLNKVVVGAGKKLTQDDTSLTEAPAGYDSVLAEVVPGGALNYDELVVYKNEAVRPSYLVMYKSP